MKDYYRMLELLPNAPPDAVRKAYRRLAKQYHPDKNPDNVFANARFLELQEAYSILSSEQHRAVYDEERWLAGHTRNRKTQIVTPAWILEQCINLNKDLANIDTYRLSPSLLQDYLLQLFSDDHLAILLYDPLQTQAAAIIPQALQAMKKLPLKYSIPVTGRLQLITGNDKTLSAHIDKSLRQKKDEEQWQRFKPYLIILAALLLCILMLRYVH